MAGAETRFAGLLAGILHHTGDKDRAKGLVARLASGEAYGAPVEMLFLNLLQTRLGEAASWAEKAIEQRDGYLLVLLSTRVGSRTAVEPALARLRASPSMDWPAASWAFNTRLLIFRLACRGISGPRWVPESPAVSPHEAKPLNLPQPPADLVPTGEDAVHQPSLTRSCRRSVSFGLGKPCRCRLNS